MVDSIAPSDAGAHTGRRRLLVSAGLGAVGTVVAASTPAAAAIPPGAGLLGCWWATNTFVNGGPIPLEHIGIVFGAGGELVANAQLNPRADVGSWSMISPTRFEFCLLAMLFSAQTPENPLPAYQGVVIVEAEGRLTALNRWEADETGQIYDQNNNPVGSQFTGKLVGMRVSPGGFVPTLPS